MNRLIITLSLLSAIAVPLGVHIGILYSQRDFMLMMIEIVLLSVLTVIINVFYIKAQTKDIEEAKGKKRGIHKKKN